MDATAILDYFRPLQEYLDQQLTAAQEQKGWRSRYTEFLTEESNAKNYMANEYEPQLIALIQKSTLADWNYNTNLTDENALLSVRNRFFIVD